MNTDNQKNSLPEALNKKSGIILPCEPEEFAEFIKSLLGQPQTMVKRTQCVFDLILHDIINFHHLINQRIDQQNKGNLIEFSGTIIFKGGYARKFKSIEALQSFHEPRPAISLGVNLAWTFLIEFPNKNHPEKQEIRVRIYCKSWLDIMNDIDESIMRILFDGDTSGVISHDIDYTERTWAEDIDNMIRNHVETLIVKENKFETFLFKYHRVFGFLSSLFLFAGLFSIVYYIKERSINGYVAKYEGISSSTHGSKEYIELKVDFIAKWLFENTGDFIYLGLIPLVASAVTVLFAIIISNLARRRKSSFLTLTEKQKDIEKKLKEKKIKDYGNLAYGLLQV